MRVGYQGRGQLRQPCLRRFSAQGALAAVKISRSRATPGIIYRWTIAQRAPARPPQPFPLHTPFGALLHSPLRVVARPPACGRLCSRNSAGRVATGRQAAAAAAPPDRPPPHRGRTMGDAAAAHDLRSAAGPSTPCTHSFRNNRDRGALIFWLDYEGRAVQYGTLEAGKSLEQGMFCVGVCGDGGVLVGEGWGWVNAGRSACTDWLQQINAAATPIGALHALIDAILSARCCLPGVDCMLRSPLLSLLHPPPPVLQPPFPDMLGDWWTRPAAPRWQSTSAPLPPSLFRQTAV